MLNFALGFALVCNLNPQTLLEKADAFRSPRSGFEAQVEVTEPNGDLSAYDVYMEGNDRSLMVTRKPERDLGRNTLMVNRDMSMYMPNIHRSVRIALRQKLVGQVAQGDISRMKWVGDYEANLLSESPTEKDGKKLLKLELKATKSDLTYDRIDLWVDAKDYRPFRAEYLTPTGKLLKFSTFEDYGPLGGSIRPRRIVIQDAVGSNDKSTIAIKAMKDQKFPTGFFTEANLAKPKLN